MTPKHVSRIILRAVRVKSKKRLFWWRGPPYNFGDWIGPYLFQRLCGYEPQYALPSNRSLRTCFVTVGSIAHRFRQDSIVWGSGMIKRNQQFWEPYETLAVRGPYTYERFRHLGYSCPEIYGDPAILLPLFFSPAVDKKYRVGVIPHYVHFEEAKALFAKESNILIIDVRSKLETVISQICSCERTLSSSLHGLIVSHSYKIPSAWADFSKGISGDQVKFLDYFASASIDKPPDPIMVTGRIPTSEIEAWIDSMPQPDLEGLRQPLLEVCPYKINADEA
jgi:pyruvyltransferase